MGLARGQSWAKLEGQAAEDLAWFADATTDAEKRTLILGAASMKKLAELGAVSAWVRWLRVQFDTADRESRELAERELARPEPSEREGDEPKWRMKVRLESGSHSVRPQPLNWWNGVSDWLKLHPVSGKHRSLVVEMTLPKAVSVHALWWTSLGALNEFLVALNIASMGLFWWEMPTRVSRFYDELMDLERNERFDVSRSPELKVDWGSQILSQDVLSRVALCMHAMPGPGQRDLHAPFDRYLTGVALAAKTDVTVQFEAGAFEQFHGALRAAAAQYGQWDPASRFDEFLSHHLASILRPDEDAERLIDVSRAIEAGSIRDVRVDLGQAVTMKLVTDAFLLARFRELAAREKESDPPVSDEDQGAAN